MRVILLGPQRRPTVDAVARSLRLDGPVATITAGWQEREADDGELSRRLGGHDTNLELYRRWLDVQDRDPVYAAGELAVQQAIAELQDTYLLRLDYALQAVYAVGRRGGGPLRAEALAESVAGVRELDQAHLRRVNSMRAEFFERLPPHDRPIIAEHRAAVARLISEAAAVIVAGGHVNVLADVLHLFNVAAALNAAARDPAGGQAAGCPVIAWSAGAMALTDRIVLFHDRAPQGPGHPEVYGTGLERAPARRRSCCRTPGPGCGWTTRRGWPCSRAGSGRPAASCWTTGRGSNTDGAGTLAARHLVLAPGGRVTALEAA